MQAHIRVIAIGIFLHEGRIFVFEGRDPRSGQVFYRPLGGGIEFGERGRDALARELREELGAEIADAAYLGAIENIFTYDGQPRHELVLVYRARFTDPHMYDAPPSVFRERDGTPFLSLWKPLDEFRTGGPPLYPAGLMELLDGQVMHGEPCP